MRHLDPTDESFNWRLYSVNLHEKTNALEGTFEIYWFENEHIGLKKTRFHKFYIPLKPFISELDFDDRPSKRNLTIEVVKLNLDNPLDLDGLNITHENYPGIDSSIYLGNAHNVFEIKKFKLAKIDDGIYNVDGDINIHFEGEAVGKNERFVFQTKIVFNEKSDG